MSDFAKSYCVTSLSEPVLKWHHDNEHGVLIKEENRLLEYLALEINQAGLSWHLVLKKRNGMRQAYNGFEVDRVAAYTEADIKRLLANPGIIRNRRKIEAVIFNAQSLRNMRQTEGGFARWLSRHRDCTLPQWVGLFRSEFRFMGPEIVREFLQGTGWSPGAHHPSCPLYERIRQQNARRFSGESDTGPECG